MTDDQSARVKFPLRSIRGWIEADRRLGDVLASPFDPRVIETGTPRPFDLSAETKFIHVGLDTKSFQIGLVHLSESHSSSMATRP